MSMDAISVSCALGLHHHDEAGAGTCPGTRATYSGSAPCECRCHAPHERRHR